MIPYKNTVKHDPENGTYGDCHRACFCTILGIDPKHVPHFYERGDTVPPEEALGAIVRFLEGRGLVQGHVIFSASTTSLEDVLRTTGALMPGVPLILGGRSSIGCGHSVVVLNGKIFNDPSGSGIVGPLKDGNYWITFLSPRPAPVSTGVDLGALLANAQALLDIDASGAMRPHGIGGLARGIITDFIAALRTSPPASAGEGGGK